MKLPEKNNVVTVGGAAPTQRAKMAIKSSDMHVVLDILRHKIYSNPKRTIVQEISSNARDAHRERDKAEGGTKWADTPIEIKLPDKYDNSFYIQDFGVGIDPERMFDVFINYGSSTKRDDNHETGGFGLGAKSPFSYTDQFGIVCVTPNEDGELWLRQYAAIIDGKDGYVSEVEARPAKADELRGTKIVIPVEEKDYNDFRKWVIETCKYWEVKPRVKTKFDKIEWPEYTADFEGNDGDWLIYERQSSGSWGYNRYNNDFNKPKAIVDGIPYPLSKSAIEDSNDADLNNDINKLWSYPVVLKFKTGEVGLTANREELDYSFANTPAMLRKKFKKIIGELQAKFSKEIKSCKDLVEANVKWNEVKSNYNNIVSSVKWNGIKVTGDRIYSDYSNDITIWQRDGSTNDGMSKSNSRHVEFSTTDMKIMYDHGEAKGVSRAKVGHIFDTHSNVKNIYVIKVRDVAAISDDHPLLKAKPALKGKATKEDFWDHFQKENNIQHMAPIDLDATPRRKRKAKAGGGKGSGQPVVAIKEYTPNSYSVRESWTNTDLDLEDDGGHIVYLKGYNAYLDSEHNILIPDNDLKYLVDKYGITIHGVLKRYANKVGDDWTPITDLIEKKWKESKKDFDAVKSVACVQQLQSDSVMRNHSIKQAAAKLPSDSQFAKIYREWESVGSDLQDKQSAMIAANKLHDILDRIGQDVKAMPVLEMPKSAKDYSEVCRERYPMLYQMQYWSIGNMSVEVLVDYFRAMDDYLGEI